MVAAAGPNLGSYAPGSAAFGNPSVFHGGQRFYVAARARMVIPAPAGGNIIFGGADTGGGAQQVFVGYYALGDATHFIMAAAGPGAPGFVVSTHLADANWHDFEGWSDGTTFYFSVDAEATLNFTMVAPPTLTMMPFIMGVSTAASGLTLDMDKYLVVFPQAA